MRRGNLAPSGSCKGVISVVQMAQTRMRRDDRNLANGSDDAGLRWGDAPQ